MNVRDLSARKSRRDCQPHGFKIGGRSESKILADSDLHNCYSSLGSKLLRDFVCLFKLNKIPSRQNFGYMVEALLFIMDHKLPEV